LIERPVLVKLLYLVISIARQDNLGSIESLFKEMQSCTS